MCIFSCPSRLVTIALLHGKYSTVLKTCSIFQALAHFDVPINRDTNYDGNIIILPQKLVPSSLYYVNTPFQYSKYHNTSEDLQHIYPLRDSTIIELPKKR